MAQAWGHACVAFSAILLITPGEAAAVDAASCASSAADDGDLAGKAARYFPDASEATINELIDCLADLDPAVRDDYAFSLWSHGLREKQLSSNLLRFAGQKLATILSGDDDAAGFRRPFAALAMSEVARADRITPIWTDQELHAVATVAADYMRDISDYRGFVEGEGWRHGVAHTADLMLQLSLNPRLSHADAVALLAALAVQVAPSASPFYHHGESQRLARPVLFLAKRADISDTDWNLWFATLHPDGSERWQMPYTNDAGLAGVHNSTVFAQSIYVGATESTDPRVQRLAPLARALLHAIP